jgi:beta-lactamase superfamily II metal-dependent hydrolase
MGEIDNGNLTHHMEVTFLDVGQGCCTVIATPHQHRVIMVDCKQGKGPAALAYLRDNDLPDPAVICISHVHDDHDGFAGIFRKLIADGVVVERVYSNYVGRTSKRCKDGSQAVADQLEDLVDGDAAKSCDFRTDVPDYKLDGVTLQVLHPNKLDLDRHHDRIDMVNDLSGVLKVSFGKSSILLPGDIKGWGASRIIERFLATPETMRSSLLLFPHHGAGWADPSPTDMRHGIHLRPVGEFVTVIGPSWCVLSVGTDNDGHWEDWQHPSQQVLDLLIERQRQNLGKFICTEATQRCDPDCKGPPPAPCGGHVKFWLQEDGQIELIEPSSTNLQAAINPLRQPQCRKG